MNENFENQKEFLLSLRHEISLLRQQIDYLIRNEKELQLLDLDVMMNRTHAIYAMLCSVNLSQNEEEQDLDFDPEAIYGLFGGMTENENANETSEEILDKTDEEPEQENIVEDTENQSEEEIIEEENLAQEEVEEEEPEMPEEEPEQTLESEPGTTEENFTEEEIVEVKIAEEKPTETAEEKPQDQGEGKLLGDDFGFFFHFEDTPEEQEIAEDETAQSEEAIEEENEPETDETPRAGEDRVIVTGDKIVHFMDPIPEYEIPERDRVNGDELEPDDPFVIPFAEDEAREMPHPTEEAPVAAPVFENVFNKEDSEFELETPETLGYKMQHDDHSLAARYQQNAVPSLKSAIGINDKFLFVNELFGGSMEKYNKSIENLDDLMNYNGAIIYLNELKVELQWNSSNVAFQKLTELINRKFNS